MAKKTDDRQAIPDLGGALGEKRAIFGTLPDHGFHVVWYDFQSERTVDWTHLLHPDHLELCLNFEGGGTISERRAETTMIVPQTVWQYSGARKSFRVERQTDQRHRLLTVVMSRDWLTHTTLGSSAGLTPETRAFLKGSRRAGTHLNQALTPLVKRLSEELLTPPVPAPCHGLWFPARIQEILAHTLIASEETPSGARATRGADERIEQVKTILAADVEHPPTLAELGRQVGCSPYHLSRLFSENTGTTISRYLRDLRLDRAAELLRDGRYNVTEAAMTVGYSSLSHFSKAFAEKFGECPCVFGLKTPLQR